MRKHIGFKTGVRARDRAHGVASDPPSGNDLESSERRYLLRASIAGSVALAAPRVPLAEQAGIESVVEPKARFPFFQSMPVSYLNVQMRDTFWASRQSKLVSVTLPWATRHFDRAGGLQVFREQPSTYQPDLMKGDLEAIKFIESMSAVVGLRRDAACEGLIRLWGKSMNALQEPDGYWRYGWPRATSTEDRWRPIWWSHEDYALGHYLEGALAFLESTGNYELYHSARRAIDNMADALLGSDVEYAPGHEEIEQALMRLYASTGEKKYLRLCNWLIKQRGRHKFRASYGKYSQDHVPVKEQRTIEGHAVRAVFLFNGVTEYVGATGDQDYRETVLSVWRDYVEHKMYNHGGGGVLSEGNEGFSSKPDEIAPNDAFCESCGVYGSVRWAHSLSRLTGDASYLDVAERMLFNAFYASLSLGGDRFFYCNVAEKDEPIERFEWHPTPCCPPNIVKLFATIGGYFYSTDDTGIFVNHYGTSEANIGIGGGVTLAQTSDYPWDGMILVRVEPQRPTHLAIRLRLPGWAKSHRLTVNGSQIQARLIHGWLTIERKWQSGDLIELRLPMTIERVTMAARFKEYRGLAALERGPIVYCIEQQDAELPIPFLYLPVEHCLRAEFRPDFLGGVTVLRGSLPKIFGEDDRQLVPVQFIPYGVWNNRGADTMRIWLPGDKSKLKEMLTPPPNPPSVNG